jgi:SAM-dependent methyltransferase
MLAHLYHSHHLTYEEDLHYWLGLAEEQGGPVLELGCGTGRVLLRIAEAGFPVVGIDNDKDMLAVLEGQTWESQIEVHEGDMTGFSFPQKFPLVILPCNTYSALTKEERLSTLRSAADHLSPGGVFSASVPNPAWLAGLPEEADPEVEVVFEHPNSGNPVQVSSAWKREADRVIVQWHYDHLLPDGQVKRHSVQASHSLTHAEEYLAEFERVGFGVKTFGDFDRSPYDSESVYLILVGTRVG